MKGCHKLLGLLALSLSAAQVSADDLCSEILGDWSGKAEASALMGMVRCTYLGIGQITQKDDGLELKFNMEKVSGSAVCQKTHEAKLTGQCTKNYLESTGKGHQLQGDLFIDEDGDLAAELFGHFSIHGLKVKMSLEATKLDDISESDLEFDEVSSELL